MCYKVCFKSNIVIVVLSFNFTKNFRIYQFYREAYTCLFSFSKYGPHMMIGASE